MTVEDDKAQAAGEMLRISSAPRTTPPLAELKSLGPAYQQQDDGGTKKGARIGVRLTFTAIIILGLFTVMVGRLWTLQVLQTQSFKRAEISTTTSDVRLTPIRGLIFARGGQLLVSNQVLPVVTLARGAPTSYPAVVPRLAALLGMTAPEVEVQYNNPISSPYEPAPIATGVSTSIIVYLAEHRSLFPGVAVSYMAQRSYPQGAVNPTLLGFVGDITAQEYASLKNLGYGESDVIGQFGVEQTFESWLRGHPGSQQLLLDPAGDVLRVRKTTPATPGDDLVLTMDLPLQRELDSALSEQIQVLRQGKPNTPAVPADWGAAVVMDPQNGDVLAMSSVPHDETYAISGYSPPGSTFKLVTATAALDDGLIGPYTDIDDTGSFQACNGPGCTYVNSPGEVPQGPINVSEALTASDDVFFYNLGADFYLDPSQYGTQPIQKMAAVYGLGKYSGIDIPGEGAGQVDNPSLPQYKTGYYEGDAVEAAFGQGATEITAMQLADAYSAFANGGTRYAPQAVAAVVNANGKVVYTPPPLVEAHVPLPASTDQAILAGLEGVVGQSKGTAYATFAGFPLSSFPLAGKTGTATTQFAQPNGLFVAFGPVADPKYVVAVIIDQAGYGADTAAPVVRTIFQWLLQHPVQPYVVPGHPAP